MSLWAAGAWPAAAQLRLAQVPIRGRAGLDSLARLGFEVADVRRVDGGLFAVIVVSPETERTLLAHAYQPAVVAGASPGLSPLATDTFRFYRSFDKPGVGIRATLAAWAATDSLIHVDSIGASVEGRPILAVKIGAPDDDPARPNVLFLATHHAREWVSTEMAMRLIRWLADSLSPTLRNTRDIWVIPVENPDGYQYTFTTDRLWRKNRRLNGNGTYGVDLNRNYPEFWGYDDAGSSSAPDAETYRGTGPASEPETRAMLTFHAAHPPVVAVSYHTYSGLVLYPYGFRAGDFSSDQPFLEALAGTDLAPSVKDSVPASIRTAYHPGPTWTLYSTNGEYNDWAYRAHGALAFTPELTSGCCTPDSGFYYGFVFPDDSVLLERVFRDNLPFALSVIAAAGDPVNAIGVSGVMPFPPRIESVWPETRVSLPTAEPAPFALTVRTLGGSVVTRSLQTDSLRRGLARVVWRSDVSTDQARAVRVEGAGLEAALITLAGAEPQDTGWKGWSRSPTALSGTASWGSVATEDTLTSPTTDLRGKRRIWLQFWTMRSGSTFVPGQRGRVQFSPDGGLTWTDVYALEGDGPAWVPVRVDLPLAANAGAARVRFIASGGFPWWVDAVGFASDSAGAFVSTAPVAGVSVSDNPVRGGSVTISWPSSAGAPRLSIYTFAGERLISETFAAGTPDYVWDLTHAGRRLPNGAYIVVVELDGQVYRKRLFVAR
ncbi:MAG TPA: M14 family zinc carboxypeptidase [Gemmatimonadales bacterium]|nr:M14 family zinc carboxypeptidase [Gemmatimonadales bacterium]